MKLDRNINDNGRGKYAILKLRKLEEFEDGPFRTVAPEIKRAFDVLERAGILDWGNTPETEFFVMRLKDRYARCGLHAYADEAHRGGDTEYAEDVHRLAGRSGVHHPNCKKPD